MQTYIGAGTESKTGAKRIEEAVRGVVHLHAKHMPLVIRLVGSGALGARCALPSWFAVAFDDLNAIYGGDRVP